MQPLSQQEKFDAFAAKLEQAHKPILSKWPHASLQWLENVEQQFKPGLKCLEYDLQNACHHTCPKTNGKDHK